MRSKEDKALQRLLAVVRQDSQILAVLLFGSGARGQQGSHSDLDICLVLTPQIKPYDPRMLAQKRLEYLGCDLDLKIFQQLPLYVRHRVLKEGQLLYVRDELALYELAYRTAQAFEDFKHFYYDYLAQVANAGS